MDGFREFLTYRLAATDRREVVLAWRGEDDRELTIGGRPCGLEDLVEARARVRAELAGALLLAGHSTREAARILGVSNTMVARWASR